MTTRMLRHLVLGAFALAPAAAFADHDEDCDHAGSAPDVYTDPGTAYPETYQNPYPTEAYPNDNETYYPTNTAYPTEAYPTTSYPAQTYPAQTYPAQTYPAQTYPAQTYPAQTYPAQTYPAESYPVQVGYAYPTVAPPAPLVERVYARPGFIWVSGYYTWRFGRYVWVAGHWERERPGYRYVSGRWDRHRDRYVWVAPTWYRDPVRFRAGFSWSPGRYQWRNGAQIWVGGSFSARRHQRHWR